MIISNLEHVARKVAYKKLNRKYGKTGAELCTTASGQRIWFKRMRKEYLMVLGWLFRRQYSRVKMAEARMAPKVAERFEEGVEELRKVIRSGPASVISPFDDEQMRNDNARDLYDEGNPKYREETWNGEE